MTESPNLTEERIAKAMTDIDLGIFEEGSEEEDSDDESEEGDATTSGTQVCFTPSQVAQAFSHYTYLTSGKKRLVCDLQGVYDKTCKCIEVFRPSHSL
mmetsp:Transcript_5461/g.8989  ORF Transcript_5461/g.8989 Transcript_5461/m.8989 type:complete len:98 (-) Transcript_5461:254-547(-)